MRLAKGGTFQREKNPWLVAVGFLNTRLTMKEKLRGEIYWYFFTHVFPFLFCCRISEMQMPIGNIRFPSPLSSALSEGFVWYTASSLHRISPWIFIQNLDDLFLGFKCNEFYDVWFARDCWEKNPFWILHCGSWLTVSCTPKFNANIVKISPAELSPPPPGTECELAKNFSGISVGKVCKGLQARTIKGTKTQIWYQYKFGKLNFVFG